MKLPAVAVALWSSILGAAAEDPPQATAPPSLIPIPDRPEGITNGPGSTLLVSQILSGAVLSVDAITGETATVVPPQDQFNGNRQAWGLWHYNDAVFVGGGGPPYGGGTPQVYVYSMADGRELATCDPVSTNVDLNGSFMNDVTVIDGKAYVTDSFNDKIMVFDADEAIENGKCEVTELALPKVFKPQDGEDWGANGVVEYAGGLLVVHLNRGFVYHIADIFCTTDVTEGVSIDGLDCLGKPKYTEVIPPGTVNGGDGLSVLDDKLYVTLNVADGPIDVFQLETRMMDNDGDTTVVATFLGNITSPEFRTPATSALYGGHVYSANSRFAEFDGDITAEAEHHVVVSKDEYYVEPEPAATTTTAATAGPGAATTTASTVAATTTTAPVGTKGGDGSGARSANHAVVGAAVACVAVALFW